jgi:uncharacterized protein YjiS (DUF1127 family)
MSIAGTRSPSGIAEALAGMRRHGLNLRAALRRAMRRRALYGRTLGELAALSDRELADIGIPRADIRRVALEHAEGRG